MAIGKSRGITKMKKLISLILLLSTTTIFADTDDNEIIITQTGDTLKLYIDQEGFGNKIGGNDFSSSGTAMLITCLLYTSPSPRDRQKSRMPSSA